MTALWNAAAALTLATLALLLAPLARRRTPPPARTEFDLSVYRDQLAEVDRDLERGLLDAEQASAARIEVERRMLAAAGEDTPAPPQPGHRSSRFAVSALLVVLVPAGAFGLYLVLGSPAIPDRPWAAGQAPGGTAGAVATMETAVEQLAERLQANPDDVDGWVLLGRSYLTMERYPEAAEAFGRAVALNDADPDLAAAYAEALVAAAEGQVTPDAERAFEHALAAAPGNPKARFYLALAKAQRGDLEGALSGWVDLAKSAPADAPWLAIVHQQIGRVAAALNIAPPLDDPSVAAEMSAEERGRMIRAMVERLAARLEEEPDDRDGWQRLARAYEVLGEADKARDARARAEALAKP